MPAPINVLPSGLLSLLGIKNGGEYPQQLSPFLQGQMDLRDLYELGTRQTFASAFQAHVNGLIQWGPTGAVTGPSPIYHINHATAHLSCTGVGAAGSVSIGFVDPSSGGYVPLTPTVFAAQAVANSTHIVSVQFSDIWLRAGFPLGVWGSNIAGAPLVSLAFVATRYDL